MHAVLIISLDFSFLTNGKFYSFAYKNSTFVTPLYASPFCTEVLYIFRFF